VPCGSSLDMNMTWLRCVPFASSLNICVPCGSSLDVIWFRCVPCGSSLDMNLTWLRCVPFASSLNIYMCALW